MKALNITTVIIFIANNLLSQACPDPLYSKRHWVSYFGSTGNDLIVDVAVDPSTENIYVLGTTTATQFLPNVTLIGSGSATHETFISCLDKNAVILWSTIIRGWDDPQAIHLNKDSSLTLVGTTSMTVLPGPQNTPTHDNTFNGGASDILILRLAQDGSSLLYQSYFGSDGDEKSFDSKRASGNIIDFKEKLKVSFRKSNDNVLISGLSNPTTNPLPVSPNALEQNGNMFFAELSTDSNTNHLIYCSYFISDDQNKSSAFIPLNNGGSALIITNGGKRYDHYISHNAIEKDNEGYFFNPILFVFNPDYSIKYSTYMAAWRNNDNDPDGVFNGWPNIFNHFNFILKSDNCDNLYFYSTGGTIGFKMPIFKPDYLLKADYYYPAISDMVYQPTGRMQVFNPLIKIDMSSQNDPFIEYIINYGHYGLGRQEHYSEFNLDDEGYLHFISYNETTIYPMYFDGLHQIMYGSFVHQIIRQDFSEIATTVFGNDMGSNEIIRTALKFQNGKAYLFGNVTSTNLATTNIWTDPLGVQHNTLQPAYGGGISDGFIGIYQNVCKDFNWDCCTNKHPDYDLLQSFYTSTNGQNWTNTNNNNNPWLSNCDPCGQVPGNTPWYGLTCNGAGEVTKITLENNNLTGILPASLNGLPKLKELRIRNNAIKGPVNNNIFIGLNDFDYLDLGQNDFGSHFQNPFPPVFPPLPSFPNSTLFKYLYLDNNGFLSAIPPSYGDYNDLLVLNLSHNFIVGDIPVSLGNYPNLLNLSLNNNQLTGPIPSTFGDLAPHIGVLRLQENNLSGCFDENLYSLCTIPTILQSHINPGNSFDVEWDVFCDLNPNNCSNPEVATLVTLYNSTNGANWTNKSGWEEGAAGTNCDPCGLICGNDPWHGITCNAQGEVTGIELPNNNLSGTLPNTLHNLPSLAGINLSNNNIGGPIPSNLGDADLTALNLSNNNLTGSIPASLSSTLLLSLSHNQLTGSIPPSFGSSGMLHLQVNHNLLCGCYDASLSNLCTSLGSNGTIVNISNGNNFNAPWEEFCSGQIGECGGFLNNCTHPDFDALAALYFGTGGLNNLWTNSTGWSGILSGNCDPCGECGNNNPWFGITCTNGRVTGINLPANNLFGNIPSGLTGMTELQTLNLSDNSLTGPLPVEFANFQHLNSLDLSNNDLTGSIPEEYCNLMPLSVLNISNNNLSGCYDEDLDCLCSLPNLNFISGGNNFPIPFSTFCAIGDGTCTDNCMDFDGVNDDLERLGLSTNGNFTLMAWFKADVVPNGGAEDRIFSFGPTTRLEIGIHHTTGNLWVHDALYGTYSINNFVRDGNWHHVVFTRNGTQRNIYLDGALVETNIASTANYGPNFRVGNWTGGGTTALFKGQIDEVAFWNYPMTSSDIQSIACDITGMETGLIAFYDFNLGVSGANNTSVTTIPDQSGNGNNLTINNMAMNGANSNLLLSGAGINSACATCFVLPTPGAISGDQTICTGADPVQIDNATVGGVSGGATLSYIWENSISPFSTWNTIVGATGATYDPPAGLTETTHYRRVTVGTLNGVSCESVPTNTIIVTVQAVPTPGAISDDQTICAGEDPSEINNTTSGTVSSGATLSYRWESSVSPYSSWNIIGGATGATYDPPASLTETTHYRRVTVGTLNGVSCESVPTNTIIVTVQAVPTPGAISDDQTICAGEDPSEINNTTSGTVSSGATLSYRWESSVSPFTGWNTIVGATTATYEPPSGLTETTHYRRITVGTLNGVSCESVPSNVVIVTIINSPPVAQCNSGMTFNFLPSVGSVTLNVSDIDNGSYTACGNNVTLSFHPTNLVTSVNYDCTQLGEQSVVLYVTNDFGVQSSCAATFTIEVNDPSIQALRAFYEATGGPNWTNTIDDINPWFSNCDPCDAANNGANPWEGITCDGNNEFVTEIRLQQNMLSGSIPPEINNLTQLTVLDLSDNDIGGSLPVELCDLTLLEYLLLGDNNFNTVPACLVNMSNLIKVDLSNNDFTGDLPNFTHTGSPNIVELHLDSNFFSGSIPPSYGLLPGLTYLSLNDNTLSGCYHPNLLNLCTQLTNSTNANISDGNIFDHPWEDFCNKTYELAILADFYFNLGGNDWFNTQANNNPWFVNCDPCGIQVNNSPWFGITCDLNDEVLQITMPLGNNLVGTIPPSIGDFPALNWLNLAGNPGLTGTIPPEICNLVGINNVNGPEGLRHLSLPHNNLTGTIPSCLATQHYLEHLALHENNGSGTTPGLEGPLPQFGSQNSVLRTIIIYNTDVDGEIPAGYGDLNALNTLQLQRNNLSGCYDPNLYNLCVNPNLNLTNAEISNGNNFYLDWEDFCANQTNSCCTDAPMAQCNSGMTFNFLPSVGSVTLHVSDINNGSYTACGNNVTLSFHPTNLVTSVNYDCTQLGEQSVVLYVTDDFGVQSSCAATFTIEVNDPSIQALRAFYEATGGPNWTNTINDINPWFSNCDPCDAANNGANRWEGITCDGNNEFVTEIRLQQNNLSGSIPPEINNLTQLTVLDLTGNDIGGSLPVELCDLTLLEYLLLGDNNFNTVPACLVNMSNLIKVDLSNNDFTGDLPNFTHTGSPNIVEIHLDGNFFSGSIPPSYGLLPGLTYLSLNFNTLSGCYHPNLLNLCTQLTNSTNANISDGNIFDHPWEDFCNKTYELAILADFYFNLGGNDWVYNQANDVPWFVNCDPCGIQGNNSPWFGITCNSNDQVLRITMPLGNNLVGTIPPSIGDFPALNWLSLAGNPGLTGTIPSEICNLVGTDNGNGPEGLRLLSLPHNNLTGTIPSCLANQHYLEHLALHENNGSGTTPGLEGPLPQFGSQNSVLHTLIIYNTDVDGEIPAGYGDLNALISLQIQLNNLSGCYDPNLHNLCVNPNLNLTNAEISNGNNFYLDWEDFCANQTNSCCETDTDLIIDGTPIDSDTYHANSTIISSGVVEENSVVVFKAGTSITLLPGFHAEEGSSFHALIEECVPLSSNIIAHEPEFIETHFALSHDGQITLTSYPNPFYHETNIQFFIPEDMEVEIHLFNMTGERAQILQPRQRMPGGEHRIVLNSMNLQAGMWYVLMRAGNEVITRKIVMIR